MQKVFFIAANKSWGSSKLRGYQISQSLQQYGIQSYFLSVNELTSDIQNSTCIWIKFPNMDAISKLSNNKHILDVVDAFSYCSQFIHAKELDGIIVNNQHMKHVCLDKFMRRDNVFVIPHHWDTELEKVELTNQSQLQFGYLGSISSLKYDENFLYHKTLSKQFDIQFLDCEFCQDVSDILKSGDNIRDPLDFERRNISNLNVNFNCHFSIRDTYSDLFHYKTSAKIATASCLGHNIITTAEKSVIDVLPPDYPFLLEDSKLDTIVSMINNVKQDYNSSKKLWNQGLTIMSEIKKTLSIDNINKKYLKLIKEISNL